MIQRSVAMTSRSALAAILLASVALAQQRSPTTPAPRGLVAGVLEVNAAPEPFGFSRNGEPHIAVNPKDRNNIVLTYPQFGISFRRPGVASFESQVSCGVSVSFDRGRSWTAHHLEVPLGLTPNLPVPFVRGYGCAEPNPAFTPDGTLYVVAAAFNTFEVEDHSADTSVNLGAERESAGPVGLVTTRWSAFPMWRSSDGGRTWSQPWQTSANKDHRKFIFDPAAKEKFYPATLFPDFKIDQSTGNLVLAVFGGGRAPKEYGTQISNIEVSRDRGKTWSKPVVIPSPEFPAVRAGYGQMDTALGQIAAVYLAGEPIDTLADKRRCPCPVLMLSDDQGKTFTRTLVPSGNRLGLYDYAMPGGTTGVQLPNSYVALDPSQKGRVAVMVMNDEYHSMQILVSSDSGKTWPTRSQVEIAEYPAPADGPPQIIRMNRPKMSFGPKGTIGVMWRQDYRPGPTFRGIFTAAPNSGPEDVYAAVSFDGGRTFSAPVKANSVPSGWDPIGGLGDDFSSILVDDDVIHVGWGAYRPDRTSWYAQIPLAAFRARTATANE